MYDTDKNGENQGPNPEAAKWDFNVPAPSEVEAARVESEVASLTAESSYGILKENEADREVFETHLEGKVVSGLEGQEAIAAAEAATVDTMSARHKAFDFGEPEDADKQAFEEYARSVGRTPEGYLAETSTEDTDK